MGTEGKRGPAAEAGPARAPAFDPRAALRGTLGAAPIASLGAVLLLGAATLLAYRGSLDNGFVEWDDDIYLRRIPQLQAWSADNVRWMLEDTRWFYWHPVAYGVHAAEIAFFGQEPRLHHFTSAVLHGLNALWVLVLACAFRGPRRGAAAPGPRPAAAVGAAALAALLWALHPLRVEAVAWMAEKKELVCAFLSFAATTAWLLHGTAGEGRRGRWYAASLGFFVLALAARPTAAALPAVFLVLDGAVLGRAARPGSLRGLVLEKMPFLVLGVAAVLYGASGDKEEGRASTPHGLGLEDRVLTPLWGFAAPLARTLLPSGLSPVDPQFGGEEIGLATLRYGGSLALLAAATVLAIRRWRRGDGSWLAAWLVYLAAAAPVSGIRQLAQLATADRFSYLPTVPFYLLAGAGILAAGSRARARLGAPGVALVAAPVLLLAGGLAALTVRQVEVWRDPETLWTRVIGEWPGRVAVAHANLGAWYANRAFRSGDRALYGKAAAQLRESLRIAPGNPGGENNLGRVAEILGDRSEAERRYLNAAGLAPRFAVPRMNLARLYARRGDRERGERWYREALATGGYTGEDVRGEVERLLGIRER